MINYWSQDRRRRYKMVAKIVISLFFLAIIGSGVCNPIPDVEPCKPSDEPCLTKLAQTILKSVIAGIPSANIEPSDPMYIELINADVAGLKYNFSKVHATGYRDCNVNGVKLDLQKGTLKYELLCKLEFRGQYVMKGRLIVLPVEGDGSFYIKTGKMSIPVQGEITQVKGKDGKDHLSIKKFTSDQVPLEPVHFDFKNLFNGNKQLSDGVHKFANENSEQVTKELSGPLFTSTVKVITKSINKYFKVVPVDEILIL